MSWIVLGIIVTIVLFGFVVVFGPPYVPTLRKETTVALDLLDLQPGQTLLELGSGDGRVMRAAATRGLRVIGVELNPLLVLCSYIVTWRYRRQVHIIWGSVWRSRWPQADGIFTFFLPRFMPRLDRRIEEWHDRPVRVASYAFAIPHKTPKRSRGGVFLYEYRT